MRKILSKLPERFPGKISVKELTGQCRAYLKQVLTSPDKTPDLRRSYYNLSVAEFRAALQAKGALGEVACDHEAKVIDSYATMLSSGKMWGGVESLDALKALSKENVSRLKTACKQLFSDEERRACYQLLELPLFLVKRSPKAQIQAFGEWCSSPAFKFLYGKVLPTKNSRRNTKVTGATPFSFFKVVADVKQRDGVCVLKGEPVLKRAWVTLADPVVYKKNNNGFSGLLKGVFYGDDIKIGVVLTIARDMKMSADQLFLDAKTFQLYLNKYSIEAKVPWMIPHEQLSTAWVTMS